MKTVRVLASCLALALVACGGTPGASTTESASAASASSDVPENFATVSPGIYRGGHPDQGGLNYLDGLGVTTIVDLEIGDFIEATPWSIDDEIREATALGINDIREPMSAFEPAVTSSFDDKINAILTILADPEQKPVYVHCAHGQDRTGLVIGLERVFNEGWTPEAAWNEMLAHGFHVEFLGLSDYFFRKTGWNPLDSDSVGAAAAGSAAVDAGAHAGPGDDASEG